MRVWELCPKKHLRSTRRKQQYYLWKTPCCWGWRSPSADLTCCLGRFPACHAFGSKMLWQSCQGLSGPQSITPSCSSMWAPMILAGETWSVASVTISYCRWRPRTWVTRWHLLDPAREEGLDENCKDSMGQQRITQSLLTIRICVLQPWDSLGTEEKMTSTSLSGASTKWHRTLCLSFIFLIRPF